MKTHYIKAFDLSSLWYNVIKECMTNGYERPVYRGERKEQKRKELDFAVLECIKPSTRPIVPLDIPDGVPPPTSVKYVNTYLEYLITPFKKEWEDYTYGERIAGRLGVPEDYGSGLDPTAQGMHKHDMIEGQRMSAVDINQLEIVKAFLKETPETNRLVIEVGKAEDLLLKHPPCMRFIQFKVRYGKLHMFSYFRSWDAWGGLPANLAALQLVKEYLAKEANLEDGKLYATSLGLHVYEGEWEYAKQVISGKVK